MANKIPQDPLATPRVSEQCVFRLELLEVTFGLLVVSCVCARLSANAGSVQASKPETSKSEKDFGNWLSLVMLITRALSGETRSRL